MSARMSARCNLGGVLDRNKRAPARGKKRTTKGTSKASKPRGKEGRLSGATPKLPPDLDEKRYFRIGEVSEMTGVKAYVLRYWESEFRWMAPTKSKSKQRLYRKKDIERILLIRRLLHEERYTIAGARKRLRELGADGIREAVKAEAEGTAKPVPEAAPGAQMTLGLDPAQHTQLRKIRDELQAIRALL